MGRVSSRDDLFLSALDMYTLLSLVFIGVAFMASYDSQERSVLDLPALPAGALAPTAAERPKEQAAFAWANPGDLRPQPSALCQIEVMNAGPLALSAGQRIPVPCWPRSFAGNAPQAGALQDAARRWASEHDRQEPEVVILCQRTQLEACGRLQWVVAEHGYRTAAVVRAGEP